SHTLRAGSSADADQTATLCSPLTTTRKGPAMPSPFPGMDPYLEAPDIWPDLHEALASEMRAELNLLLPQPYYARLEVRPEVGVVDAPGTLRRSGQDVTVVR